MNDKKEHNEEYLNQKLGKSHGFSTPKEDYFSSFEDNFFAKLSEETLPKAHGFKSPEDYFDTLEDQIVNKLDKPKTNNTSKVITFRRRVLQYSSIAAAAAVLLFIVTYFYPLTDSVEDISIADVDEWFENGNASSDELAMFLTNEDFSNEELFLNIEDVNTDDFIDMMIDDSSLLDELQ